MTILGITPQEKVLSYGFACGQTNFEPTIPLAGLISPHGETEIYYFDPQVGVVRTSTKTPPHEADRIVLTSFFEIAANFEFRRGQY